MTPNFYQLLEKCVHDGALRGLHRANKYEVKSDEDFVEIIQDAVMLEISEWFNFTDEQLGIPSECPESGY